MAAKTPLFNRVAPWRFVMFLVLLVAGVAISVGPLGWTRGALVGFDLAALAFLVSCYWTFDDDPKTMRKVAEDNDANRIVLLVLSFAVTVIILAAMTVELAEADKLTIPAKLLIAASLVLVWTFANAVYMLHYCHLFYTSDDKGKDCAGLDFPGTKEPLMSDFAYFSFTLGVAVQTSDVCVTSPHIRKVVTAHCVAGFFFNLGVLALTINVLGSS